MVSFVDILRWTVHLFLALVITAVIIFIFLAISIIGSPYGFSLNMEWFNLAVYGGTLLFSILIIMLIVIIGLVYIPNILREREEE